MNRYRQLALISPIFGVTTAAALARFGSSWLERQSVPGWVVFVLYLLIIVIGSQIVQALLERTLESSRYLRSFWLGDQYIEGTWIDVVMKGDECVGVGVVNVMPDAGTIRLSGEDFDLNGNSISHFKTTKVFINWPFLTFIYEAHRTAKNSPPSTGISYWFIDESGKISRRRRSGHFTDEFTNVRYDVKGWRENDETILARLAHDGQRPEAIQEIIRVHGSRRDSDIPKPVGAT